LGVQSIPHDVGYVGGRRWRDGWMRVVMDLIVYDMMFDTRRIVDV
jgi:hypothetical protein